MDLVAALIIALYAVNDQWAFRCQRLGRRILQHGTGTVDPKALAAILPGRYVASVWIGRILLVAALGGAWQAWSWYGVIALLAYTFVLAAVLDLVSPWPSYAGLLRQFENRIRSGKAGIRYVLLLPVLEGMARELGINQVGDQVSAQKRGVEVATAGAELPDLVERAGTGRPSGTAPTQSPESATARLQCTRAVLGKIASELAHCSPMGGDDSPLPNLWEEIKDQLQNERSVFWKTYAETMRQFVSSVVGELDDRDLWAVTKELRCSSTLDLERKLLRRLVKRGKAEKLDYLPFDFEFFSYRILDFTAYGRVIRRTGVHRCYARVFSVAAPAGELGTVDCVRIEEVLTRAEFEEARAKGWS